MTAEDAVIVYDRIEGATHEGFRWHRIAAGNREPLSHGGESFTTQDSAIRAAFRANPDVDRVSIQHGKKGNIVKVIYRDGEPE
jgi:hypothetical protein